MAGRRWNHYLIRRRSSVFRKTIPVYIREFPNTSHRLGPHPTSSVETSRSRVIAIILFTNMKAIDSKHCGRTFLRTSIRPASVPRICLWISGETGIAAKGDGAGQDVSSLVYEHIVRKDGSSIVSGADETWFAKLHKHRSSYLHGRVPSRTRRNLRPLAPTFQAQYW